MNFGTKFTGPVAFFNPISSMVWHTHLRIYLLFEWVNADSIVRASSTGSLLNKDGHSVGEKK
jgi:hypothetical protein